MVALAGLLTGIWLIVVGAMGGLPPAILTLIVGIVVAVLCALALLGIGFPNAPATIRR